jgi:Abnormal spindle-like microcephaly-assoc'd, ASPM-SPD-2-Hydin
MSGWFVRDENSPVRTMVGTLTDVYNADDGDTNLVIVPNADSAPLLANRHGMDNITGTIECEINVTEDGNGRSSYESWVASMVGMEVTAQGVYVDDTGHEDKTELHPTDILVVRVDRSAQPQDWIGELAAQHGLQVGGGLFAYRYAAASDDRDDGLNGGWPPFSRQTRVTTVKLPFPIRPVGAVSPEIEARSAEARNAASHIDLDVTGDPASATLVVTVKADGHGGPGFDLAEVALYWVGSRVVEVSPSSLGFGLIGIGESVVRRFTVINVGSAPATITVPGSTFPGAFGWSDVPTTTLAPGGSFVVTVEFSPLAAGVHTGTVSVISDAAGSPHRVRLDGRARAGTPQ